MEQHHRGERSPFCCPTALKHKPVVWWKTVSFSEHNTKRVTMTNRFCDKCDLVKDDKIVLVKINDLPRYSLQSKYDIKKLSLSPFFFCFPSVSVEPPPGLSTCSCGSLGVETCSMQGTLTRSWALDNFLLRDNDIVDNVLGLLWQAKIRNNWAKGIKMKLSQRK